MDSKKSTGVSGDTKRKHQPISIQDKVELLQQLERGVSVRKLCDLYGIGSSTVYDIKKQKAKILTFYADSDSKKQMSVRKTMKDGKSTEHDRVMMEWFRQRRNDEVHLTGRMLMEQAKIIHRELELQHECEYGEGWLQRFKKRHGISMHKVRGDKRSLDHEETVPEYMDEFTKSKIVASEHLSPDQLYSAYETLLYWRCAPGETLMSQEEEGKGPVGFRHRDFVSVDKLIELSGELIKGLEQCGLVTEQELMNLYLLHEKLRKEKLKHVKQIYLNEAIEKITKKIVCPSGHSVTSEKPIPSTSNNIPGVHHGTFVDQKANNSELPEYSDPCD